MSHANFCWRLLAPDVARKLVIIAPRSRKRKLDQVLQHSTFMGHPLYMENKVMYVFADELVKLYHDLQEAKLSDIINQLQTILHPAMQ